MCCPQGYTFQTSSLGKSINFGNFNPGKGMLFGNLVKEKSNFCNSCIDTQNFGDFGSEKAKI